MYLTPAIILGCRIYTYLHDNHYKLLIYEILKNNI